MLNMWYFRFGHEFSLRVNHQESSGCNFYVENISPSGVNFGFSIQLLRCNMYVEPSKYFEMRFLDDILSN